MSLNYLQINTICHFQMRLAARNIYMYKQKEINTFYLLCMVIVKLKLIVAKLSITFQSQTALKVYFF